MKKILLLLTVCVLGFNISFSQCRDFASNEVVPKLDEYLLTGRYHAMKLYEGEEILIFKTVNRGLTYRFIVMSENTIPQPHFVITNWDNQVIYDNSKDDNSIIYDYKTTTTQRVKIIIKIPKSTTDGGTKDGCVSLVMGVKSD